MSRKLIAAIPDVMDVKRLAKEDCVCTWPPHTAKNKSQQAKKTEF